MDNFENNNQQTGVYFTPPNVNTEKEQYDCQNKYYNSKPNEFESYAIEKETQNTVTIKDNEHLSNDNLSIASLICGILSLFFPVFAIPGLITGYLYKNKSDKSTQGNKQTKIGIICSYVSFVNVMVAATLIILAASAFAKAAPY